MAVEGDEEAMAEIRRTPLFEKHKASGGRMVDFAGWEMPIQYPEGIVAEHHAVRQGVGVFDVSHMGRVEIRGRDALAAIQPWICNDAAALADGQALYSPICYPEGGIVDDCLVYRLADTHYLIVINASNRQKDYDWFASHLPKGLDAHLTEPEEGDRWAMIAIQGPKTREILGPLASVDLGAMKHNQIVAGSLAGVEGSLIACTGYTGEDGFEVMIPSQDAGRFWDILLEKGVKPCGLGSRDTLRMEMRYPLYGHDIDQTTTPIEAGLAWTVKPNKGEFLGRSVLVEQIAKKPSRRLVGFVLKEKALPRHGYTLWHPDSQESIGPVTSGGFAPSLQQPIGIGYVPSALASVGTSILVDIRGKRLPAEIVKTPFYKK